MSLYEPAKEGRNLEHYRYGTTENFDDALKNARDTAQHWQQWFTYPRPAYMGYEEGRGWWVDHGDFLPNEPDLVVYSDGRVMPYWMTEPKEEG